MPQYEFRGKSIHEAVQKATGRQLCYKGDRQKCQQLERALARRRDVLDDYHQDLERLKRRITRLKDRLEDEKATASYENSIEIAQAIIAIASIIPAVRAVQIGIRTVRAATGVARAIAAGDTLSGALLGVGPLSIVGLEFLKPSTKRQLEQAMREVEMLKDHIDRHNRSMLRILKEMERHGCHAVEV